jgi:tripartite-type tricarboxylate transporter receptor subunit TctC
MLKGKRRRPETVRLPFRLSMPGSRLPGAVFCAFLLCCAMAPACAVAQQYPARPVRMVVGFAVGGATDLSARFLAQKLSETLGQQVVVENRPGAASTLASDLVARGAPDGYTLLFANATVAMPSLFANLSFDVRKDFAPVSLVGYGPLVMVAHPSLPVKSVKELIALARRKPGALNYGSAGVGSMTHLGMALFISMARVDMVHVPYKGSAPASIGILTGEAQLMFTSPAAVMTHIREGKLRALGVSGTARSAVLPDVPTLADAGVTGYDATSWYGLLAPSATPRSVISRLGDESVKALSAADLKERLLSQSIEPARGGVDEFSAYLSAEIPKWAKVIKAAGIPPQ